MSVDERVYRSLFFLVLYTTVGITCFVNLITLFWEERVQWQELVTSVLWVSLSIIYFVDWKCRFFPKHRKAFIMAMYSAGVILAIFNEIFP